MSMARKTVPIPPRATNDSIAYRPKVCPGVGKASALMLVSA
ncbi:hypothetical protein AKJ09_06199 [Labilithrix luteola]|uniref:Uncharacterized protein n=1 Tax=Labilithrix luteola TaxID=1391654 RepID=A0A0K1Q173_9BACT|nr:hypothetical protein AKJ09_06199 [Labilithrix luteola]